MSNNIFFSIIILNYNNAEWLSKERFDLLAGENKRGIQFVKLVNKKPISL